MHPLPTALTRARLAQASRKWSWTPSLTFLATFLPQVRAHGRVHVPQQLDLPLSDGNALVFANLRHEGGQKGQRRGP